MLFFKLSSNYFQTKICRLNVDITRNYIIKISFQLCLLFVVWNLNINLIYKKNSRKFLWILFIITIFVKRKIILYNRKIVFSKQKKVLFLRVIKFLCETGIKPFCSHSWFFVTVYYNFSILFVTSTPKDCILK